MRGPTSELERAVARLREATARFEVEFGRYVLINEALAALGVVAALIWAIVLILAVVLGSHHG